MRHIRNQGVQDAAQARIIRENLAEWRRKKHADLSRKNQLSRKFNNIGEALKVGVGL